MDNQRNQDFTNQLFRAPILNSNHNQPSDIELKFNYFTPTDESLMFDKLLGDADQHQSSFAGTTGLSFLGCPANAVFNFDTPFVFPSDQSFAPRGVTQHSPFADAFKNNALLQQPLAPFQYNLNNQLPYNASQIQQSTDLRSNGIYQPQHVGVHGTNAYLPGFNQGLPPVQQQPLPTPLRPDPGFFPYFNTRNTDHQQTAGHGGLSYFHDDNMDMIGGLSDPDHLTMSSFDIDVEAVRAYYSNASSPSTPMGGLDMGGRSTSEPSGIGGSPFWNDRVATEKTAPIVMDHIPKISERPEITGKDVREKERWNDQEHLSLVVGDRQRTQGSKISGRTKGASTNEDWWIAGNLTAMAVAATTTLQHPPSSSLSSHGGSELGAIAEMGNDLSREGRDSKYISSPHTSREPPACSAQWAGTLSLGCVVPLQNFQPILLEACTPTAC
jgi:hypothetical protein